MKKLGIYTSCIFVGLFLFGMSITLADEGVASRRPELVTKLHAFFPTVKGMVISVEGEEVFIDLGMEHELVSGAQLAFLQEGVNIVHPTTGKVLGTYEKVLGTLQVTEVREQFSLARILWTESDVEIVPGTVIGGIPGRIKIALLPLLIAENDPATHSIFPAFVRALRDDSRFTVFDEADVKAAALNAGVDAEQLTQKRNLGEIASLLTAHNFVQMRLQQADARDVLAQVNLLMSTGEKIGNVYSIVAPSETRQTDITERQVPSKQTPQEVLLTTPVEMASSAPSASMSQEPAQDSSDKIAQRVKDEFWRSDLLRLKIHKIAVGDLTGDGRNEVVLTSQTDIEIYGHGTLGEKDSFHLLSKIKGFYDLMILGVDVADINQNGRSEIFFTTLRTTSAEVQVFEYTDGQFKEIWSKNGVVMRVLERPNKTPLLVGQSSTASLSFDFLSGKIYEYAWKGDEYVRQEALDIPGRVNRIFGMTLADVDNNGADDVLFYDKNDRIQLFQNGQLQWRSRAFEPYNMNVLRKEEDENTVRKAPGRIALTHIAADDDMRLVLIHNLRSFKILNGLPMYNGSEFLIFRWNGEKFVKEMTSEEFASYTSDYTVADVDNDGRQELLLAMVLRGDNYFKTPQSQLVVYELEK